MSNKKELIPLLRKLREQGFDVDIARGSTHYRVVAPDGRKCNIAYTPRSTRGLKNIVTRLKRIGYRP